MSFPFLDRKFSVSSRKLPSNPNIACAQTNIPSECLSRIRVLSGLSPPLHTMYAPTSAWQAPKPHHTEPRTVHLDLRDRVKTYAARDVTAAPPSHDHLSPTDAFFGGGPNAFANQKVARPALARRPQKHHQVQSEPEKQLIQQEPRLTLTDLQSHQSPLARELIGKQRSLITHCLA